MSQKEMAVAGENGLAILRAMGMPILFDGRGNQMNLGVANKWVTLFNLTTFTDRIFIGLEVYNPGSNPLYLAFEQVLGSEVRASMIEPGAAFSLDSLTIGPGKYDKWQQKRTNYIRAMVPATVGTAAAATATFTLNIPNLAKLLLGSTTYLFQSALSSTPAANTVNVAVGASLAATLTNLAAAINLKDGNVTASASATVLTVISNWAGTGMNSYVFADGSPTTGGTFIGTGTLGGAGASVVGSGGTVVDANLW